LREEHRLSVFENRVLRGVVVPKRELITEKLRKLQTGSFITRIVQLIPRK